MIDANPNVAVESSPLVVVSGGGGGARGGPPGGGGGGARPPGPGGVRKQRSERGAWRRAKSRIYGSGRAEPPVRDGGEQRGESRETEPDEGRKRLGAQSVGLPGPLRVRWHRPPRG